MKNIVIIGAGDLGKELVWLIEDINRIKPTYVILGFLDGNKEKIGKQFYGYEVVGTESRLKELAGQSDTYAVIAIKEGSIRKKIYEEYKEFVRWETIIHPSAVIAATAHIGKGCIIFPKTTVSIESNIGAFNICYMGTVISNNCEIGNYVSMMVGVQVAGHVLIEDESYLGYGCYVDPGCRIAKGTSVTNHSVISDNSAEKVKYKRVASFF